MRAVFTKPRDARDFPHWVVHNGKRRVAGGHIGAHGRHLSHDIVTFVVERELDIRDGFFGTVASGGVFRSMPRARKPSRRAPIARNRGGIDAAERTVNQHWDAWLKGQPTPCAAALDDACRRWTQLEPGESLTLEFLDLPAHPARSRR